MVSINTNLTSLITQRSLNQSTNKLNQAIERMSTGYKINHAGDNAANYSISTNMSTQLSACDIAADNISMGMDLLQTAQDTIAGMQDRGSRIHALITQARNGTYGADSLNAMAQEAGALVSEINRLYVNTEYNGIKLFDNVALPDWAQEVKSTAGKINGKSLEECALSNNGFIQKVVEETPEVTITNPDELEDAISTNTKIGIGNAETLAKLAELVNDGTATCSGKTIILTEDIDLSEICAANTNEEGIGGWTPIGYYSDRASFEGTFNGNGHKITGLYINRPDAQYQALFGYSGGDIKNVGVSGSVKGDQAGILVGFAYNVISNCYTAGNVVGYGKAGGLAATAYASIENSYSNCDVHCLSSASTVGGLAAEIQASVDNCYSTGNVISDATGRSDAGGLIGYTIAAPTITNSYATGNVKGNGNYVGGLIGNTSLSPIRMCYATGDVKGNDYTGGLSGVGGKFENCYHDGNVNGADSVGGIATARCTLSNCFVVGDIEGTGENVDDICSARMTANGEIGAFKHETTSMQVGINSDEDSQINVDTNLKLNLHISDLTSDNAYNSVTSFLSLLSQKSTEFGAAQNRLESALESTMVKMDNLTSSLSTIRDADIGKVSSDYIRQQILQQACATLMSTANQSPSIALQLL